MPVEVLIRPGIDFSMSDASSHLEVQPAQIQILPSLSDSLRTHQLKNSERPPSVVQEISLPANMQLHKLFQKEWAISPKEIIATNPSTCFRDGKDKLRAYRVEPRGDESKALTVIIRETGDVRELLAKPVFKMQDPFASRVHGELVLGGVQTWRKEDGDLEYKTVFHKGRNISGMDPGEPFAEGPDGMKDIRLVGLPNGRVGVYTRPQGEVGGLGQIGYTEIDSLDDLNADIIRKAPLIPLRFPSNEWGGVNQAISTGNGRVLAIGHRAMLDDKGKKHYFAWGFLHDTNNNTFKDLGIIAQLSDFSPGNPNILFPAGIEEAEKIERGAKGEQEMILTFGERDSRIRQILFTLSLPIF